MLDSKRWYCAPGGERIRVLSTPRQASGDATQGRGLVKRGMRAVGSFILNGAQHSRGRAREAAVRTGVGGGAGPWRTGGRLARDRRGGSGGRGRQAVRGATSACAGGSESREAERGRERGEPTSQRPSGDEGSAATNKRPLGKARARVSAVQVSSFDDKSARQTTRPLDAREACCHLACTPRQPQPFGAAATAAAGGRRRRAHKTCCLRRSSAGAVRRSRVQRASQGSMRLRNPGDQSEVAERDKTR